MKTGLGFWLFLSIIAGFAGLGIAFLILLIMDLV